MDFEAREIRAELGDMDDGLGVDGLFFFFVADISENDFGDGIEAKEKRGDEAREI